MAHKQIIASLSMRVLLAVDRHVTANKTRKIVMLSLLALPLVARAVIRTTVLFSRPPADWALTPSTAIAVVLSPEGR